MTIVFLEVSPAKLTNRELVKIYDRLKASKKLRQTPVKKLESNLQKANHIRRTERKVTIRLPRSKRSANDGPRSLGTLWSLGQIR